MTTSSRCKVAWGAIALMLTLLSSNGDAAGRNNATAVQVLTQHNDSFRTGTNSQEKVLTPDAIRTRGLVKKGSYSVDGQIYGQPLYLPNVPTASGNKDLVIVATMSNTVYAFNANPAIQSSPVWKQGLDNPIQLPDPKIGPGKGAPCKPFQSGYCDMYGTIGIVSTPVIDPTERNGVIFVVTTTKDMTRDSYLHKIYRLDATNGNTLAGSPKTISAQGFSSNLQLQRSGLLLSQGRLYVAFAAYGDNGDFHGWVFVYDSRTLNLINAFNTTPNGKQGGIWQAGQGLAADDNGNVYFMTGNGSTTTKDPSQPGNVANAIVKMSLDGKLVDWFSPWNTEALSADDEDLGSSGAFLLRGSGKTFVSGGGKQGILYVLDSNNLGKWQGCPTCSYESVVNVPANADTGCSSYEKAKEARNTNGRKDGDPQIHQWFQATEEGCQGLYPARSSQGYHHIHGGPVLWNNQIYVWGEADKLRSYRFDPSSGKFNLPGTSSSLQTPSKSMPGAMLSISADGTNNGVLWATHPIQENANQATVPGLLRAINASDINQLLWSSDKDPGNALGSVSKFAAPTIANGRVYVSTFSNQLVVYGLK